jgi:hypothetical protein
MHRALLWTVLIPAIAQAQVPGKLGYQGRLLDSSGSPVVGPLSVTFNIYSTATLGTPLWTEAQTVVFEEGFYSVYLGDVTPFPSTLFSGAELYLELAPGTSGPLSPRQRIDSVAYALMAQSLSGGSVNATSISVNGNTVINSSGQLAGAAAYSAGAGSGISINGGAISVNSSGCSMGQVLQWTGTAWVCATPTGGGTYSASFPVSLNGTVISLTSTCATGQVLEWNGSQWICTDMTGGGGGITSVTASMPLSASGGTTPNISLSGIVGLANGGTGANLSATGGAGQFLKQSSAGSALTVGAIAAADVPAGSGYYIQNQSAQPQTASFNINGTGYVAGNLVVGSDAAAPDVPLIVNAGSSPTLAKGSGFAQIGGDSVGTDANLAFGWDRIQARTAAGAASNFILQANGGSVGIGTTSPAATLDVNGSGNVSGNLKVGSLGAGITYTSCTNCPSNGSCICSCPSGQNLLGGGASVAGSNNHLRVSEYYSGTQWYATCENSSGTVIACTDVRVICAHIN